MFALSPSQTLTLTLISAPMLALVVSVWIAKTRPIPNHNVSLARTLASFVATWLIWGSSSGAGNGTTATTQIGLIPYLTLEHSKPAEQWLAQVGINWGALTITLMLTGLILFGLSFVLGRLAAINDHRR